MRIAFVYDRLNKFGGAERILLALHKIWPEAPLYTAVYNKKKAAWADVFQVRESFLRRFPFLSARHELIPFLTPLAFESFDFDKFDVVLTITSAEAKAVLTKPKTLHICYCLTPTRYLWSGFHDYRRAPGTGILNPLAKLVFNLDAPFLRYFDYIASRRPDVYVAISKTVADRIFAYYGRRARIIYPPVKEKKQENVIKKDYYLIVSRLVPYKRIDFVLDAFNKINRRIIIIGRGNDELRLKKIVGPNVRFITRNLTDKELDCYYQECKAFIFPSFDDFGLTSVEAQMNGTPVIAYNKGGVAESVISSKTGVFFDSQTPESIINAIEKFESLSFSSLVCRQNAMRFSESNFLYTMEEAVTSLWKQWLNKI